MKHKRIIICLSVVVALAATYGSATPFTLSALFAAALALFVVTMALNFVAATFIARSRSGGEV